MKSSILLTSAALALSTAAFANQKCQVDAAQMDCYLQGEILPGCNPAYNAPAVYDVTRKSTNCTIPNIAMFADVSFIYWYAGEEGLKVASTGALNSGTIYYTTKTQAYTQEFEYNAGFKLTYGITSYHDWTIQADYTWFRNKTFSSSGDNLTATVPTAGTAAATSGSEVWVVDDWFLQGTPSQALAGSKVASSWHLSMDLIDLVAGRPYYESRRLVMSPYAGLQAAFIRQSMTVNLSESIGLFGGDISSQPLQSRNHSHSWSLGPIVGCDAHCLFPGNWRLEGTAAASVLYTQYTSIRHSEDAASTTFNDGPYKASYSDYGCIRPMAELGLGLGWGEYIYDQRYHIDFSADYDFMIFWAQNVMRRLLDDTLTGTGSSASDLYVHGLTVTGRFDF